MNDAELERKLEAILVGTQTLITRSLTNPRDGLTLLGRMMDSYNGWPPSSGYDRGSRRATDAEGELLPLHADPTGEAGSRPDRARDDRERFEKNIKDAARLLAQALDIANRYTLRDANPIEREASATKDDGCTSCYRIHGPRTNHWWNPIYRGTLCRFCWEMQRALGRLPTLTELHDHRDGKKVRRLA